MGVVYQGFRWRPTDADCAGLSALMGHAAHRDAAALQAIGAAALGQADRRTLAAFGLDDHAYVAAWLDPRVVHPALVALLTLVPALAPLPAAAAAGLARRCRTALVGPPADPDFATLPDVLDRWRGATPLGDRALPADLGFWGPEHPSGSRIAWLMPTIGEPWLVSTAIW